MPFGGLFRKDDTRDDYIWLDDLVRLKASADMHINTVRTFQLHDTVTMYSYHHRDQGRRRVVGTQDDWQDANDYVEERLDWLRGGGRVEHEIAWWLFTTQSVYSPIRLQNELAWQPTPRGLPSHCDPSLFGWVDAFEDLLAVSSATPMMSFERREAMNKAMVWTQDTGHWFLFNRIQWQGLNEVYFPVYWPDLQYRSPRSMEEWVAVRREVPIPCNNWEQAVRDLARNIHKYGGWSFFRYMIQNPGKEQLPEGEPTLESVVQVFRELAHMVIRGRFEAQGQDVPPKKPDAPRRPTREPAQTEEDLYSDAKFKSDDKMSDGPFASLFRIMGMAGVTGRGEEKNSALIPIEMDKDARKTEHKLSNGGSETVVSEKIQTLRDGQDRISVISIEQKDEHGRVISSNVHVLINQAPFTSPFWRKFWENARPRDGTGGSRGEDSK